MTNKKINSKVSGFTLIEVLVSAAILVILGAGFLGLQYMFSENQIVAWQAYFSVEDANGILSNMVKELRDASQSENGSYPFVEFNDQEIIFYSDINSDGKTERVRYTLSSNQLIKGVIQPTGNPATYPTTNEKVTVLSSNIRNLAQPVFYYYNNAWPNDTTNNPLPLATRLSNTSLIKINLRLNTKANDSKNDYVLESYTQPRILLIGQ